MSDLPAGPRFGYQPADDRLHLVSPPDVALVESSGAGFAVCGQPVGLAGLLADLPPVPMRRACLAYATERAAHGQCV